MIIDCHTHCFPAKIAAAALSKMSRTSGALAALTDGTVDGIKAEMARCGLDAAFVLNIATSPTQQQAVNRFAVQINSPSIISFGSVHPEAPDAFDELDKIAALGLKGVKFHPFFQHFSIDDSRLFPLYRRAAALGLITAFHTGYDVGFADSECASPAALARALPVFGGAPVIAAHLGGAFSWQAVQKWLVGLPVYLDTAFSYGNIPMPEARKIIEKHGAGHILFGSDQPWSDVRQEMAFIRSFDLAEPDLQQIMGGNAQRLLMGGSAPHLPQVR